MTEPMPPFPLTLTLVAAGRRAQLALDDALGELGLSVRHLGALGHVSRDEDLSVSDLARRSGVTAQSMHATIRELEAMGAMARDADGRGRRSRLTVTSEGTALMRRGMAAVSRADADVVAQMGELSEGARTSLARWGFPGIG